MRAKTKPPSHEAALSAFCRQAVRGVLLAGSLGPLGCDRPARPVPAGARAAKPTLDAAVTPRSVFDAEKGPPVAPARPSETFTPFPCGAPMPERPERERIWNSPTEYERYQRMAERLELDLRGRSLNLPSRPDYVQLSRGVESNGVRGEGVKLQLMLDRLAEHGTACSGARDKARCAAELKRQSEAVFAHEHCDMQECTPFFHLFAQTTHGDQVRTWDGVQQLSALFGDIDTPMEGWFLLVAQRHFPGFSCGEGEPPVRHGIAYRTLLGGHLLRGITATSTCRPLTFRELTYEVTHAGAVRQVDSRVVSDEPEGCVVSGRRPPGFAGVRGALRSLVDLLTRSAELESASIAAFELLAAELAALGAPRALIARVVAARDDETSHAACMAALTQRLGGDVQCSAGVLSAPRDRLALALDNAREGCVRELYGALMAAFQASRAQLPILRDVFARIAEDELRHAALSWDLADWLEQGLDASEQKQVTASREAALEELCGELAEPAESLRRDAGMPSLSEAKALSVVVADWIRMQAREGARASELT